MKKFNLALISVLCLLSFVFSSGITVPQQTIIKEKTEETAQMPEHEVIETSCVARIKKIILDTEEELPGGNKQRSQQLLLEILSGNDKGKERVASNVIPDNPAFSIIGEVGRKYLVTKIEGALDGKEDYFIVDYFRENFVYSLIGLFFLVIIAVGGVKGIKTIISLLIVIAFIAFLLLPSIEAGINPLLSAVIVSMFATGITMLLVAGKNMKSLAATIGTGVGVLAGGIIATFVIKYAPLSGLASTEAMILWGNRMVEINFKGLLAAGMIVSCLGAVMDTAISIASSIHEIKLANPNYSFKQFYLSGMNVGKDVMGTMTNTLVLAYTGMALPLLLLIHYEKNPAKFLNLELVVSEVTAAIAGSIGLVIAVPVTAIIMSYLVSVRKKGNGG